MILNVVLPHRQFITLSNVLSLTVDTLEGSYGFLPRRRDCVAPLVPGIIAYQEAGQEQQYIAVDKGLLVKQGNKVTVTVRRAVRGPELEKLHQLIRVEYLTFSQKEQALQQALDKLESRFMQSLSEIAL